MGVNEGSLQVIDTERHIGKSTYYIITIRYILITSSSACGVCSSHYILRL